jgi:uncharacterized membrane protein
MKKRLIISSIIFLPVLLIVTKIFFKKPWDETLVSVAFQEIFFVVVFYLFLVWSDRKTKQSEQTK